MVGDICIVGEPNASGEIEIGYGTYEEFQQKGFMTEAVGGIIKCQYRNPQCFNNSLNEQRQHCFFYNIKKE